MTDELDTLLSAPLADVADNGFSNRTAVLLELERLRRERFHNEVYAGLVLLAVMVLPFTPLGAVLTAAAYTHAGVALIGLTAGAIFLMSWLKRPSNICLSV